MKDERGFTIVELLIVIVVIGILAAIVIVAYNGVQNRARTTEAQANAKEVQNKAEVYNADQGSYPADATAITSATGSAALSEKVDALVKATAPSSSDKTAIQYTPCGTPVVGAEISYWDYTTNGVSTDVLTVGDTSACT